MTQEKFRRVPELVRDLEDDRARQRVIIRAQAAEIERLREALEYVAASGESWSDLVTHARTALIDITGDWGRAALANAPMTPDPRDAEIERLREALRCALVAFYPFGKGERRVVEKMRAALAGGAGGGA